MVAIERSEESFELQYLPTEVLMILKRHSHAIPTAAGTPLRP